MRTKEKQAGTACKQNPGMTSYTGNSVLSRTLKNTPPQEHAIRGMEFTKEDMQHVHRANLAAIPYEIFERVMVRHGAILVEEVA